MRVQLPRALLLTESSSGSSELSIPLQRPDEGRVRFRSVTQGPRPKTQGPRPDLHSQELCKSLKSQNLSRLLTPPTPLPRLLALVLNPCRLTPSPISACTITNLELKVVDAPGSKRLIICPRMGRQLLGGKDPPPGKN